MLALKSCVYAAHPSMVNEQLRKGVTVVESHRQQVVHSHLKAVTTVAIKKETSFLCHSKGI